MPAAWRPWPATLASTSPDIRTHTGSGRPAAPSHPTAPAGRGGRRRRATDIDSEEREEHTMGVSLSKGGNVSLTKEAPGLKNIVVGLGWDMRVTDGSAFDLD